MYGDAVNVTVGLALTVNVRVALFTAPHGAVPLTTARYRYPFIDVVTPVNVNVVVVAPLYTPPLFISFQVMPPSVLNCHW